MFYFTLGFAFNEKEFEIEYSAEITFLFFLFFDMIINMNKGFYEKGEFIRNRKKIAYKYISSNQFKYDVIVILCIIIHIPLNI